MISEIFFWVNQNNFIYPFWFISLNHSTIPFRMNNEYIYLPLPYEIIKYLIRNQFLIGWYWVFSTAHRPRFSELRCGSCQRLSECTRGRHIHHLEASHGEPGEICVSAEHVRQNWQNVQSEQLPIHQVIVSTGKLSFQGINCQLMHTVFIVYADGLYSD